MDNNQIKTAMQSGATWMKVSAIISLAYQGLSLLGGASNGTLFQNVLGSALAIFLAITLLQASNEQSKYAAGGSEAQLLEGLKKEALYLQIISILMFIGVFFVAVSVVLFGVFSSEILEVLEQAIRRGGRF